VRRAGLDSVRMLIHYSSLTRATWVGCGAAGGRSPHAGDVDFNLREMAAGTFRRDETERTNWAEVPDADAIVSLCWLHARRRSSAYSHANCFSQVSDVK